MTTKREDEAPTPSDGEGSRSETGSRSAPESRGSGKAVRYDGLADVIRLGEHRWRRGETVRVPDDVAAEALTYPGERFTEVPDEPVEASPAGPAAEPSTETRNAGNPASRKDSDRAG
jgi:hypothetical protein